MPRLKAIATIRQADNITVGGSDGYGTGGGYVCGGWMNPACAKNPHYVILSKECGVEVNPKTLQRALRFFYRFVGHAGVPYGNHRPEMWLSCNGKNGMIACPSFVRQRGCQWPPGTTGWTWQIRIAGFSPVIPAAGST